MYQLLAQDDNYSLYLIDYNPVLANQHLESTCNLIIAGGSALSIAGYRIANKSISYNDRDYWGEKVLPKSNRIITFKSEWADTYEHGVFQIMKRPVDSPLALLESFDMTICRCALYDFRDDVCHMLLHREAEERIIGSDRGYISCTSPSIKRLWKYARRFGVDLHEMFSPEDIDRAAEDVGYEHVVQPQENPAAALMDFLDTL